MTTPSSNHIISSATIRALWDNWAIAFGAISLVMLCSLFVHKFWLPFILLGIALIGMSKLKAESGNNHITACRQILWAMVLIVFWSAIVMILINVLTAKWFFGGLAIVEPFNPQHPYISSLIVFPVALFVSLYMLIRGHDMEYCRKCRMRYGYYPGKGIVSTFFYHETRYQLRMLLWLSLLLSAVDWAYYYFFYINVNYNKPDKFYFIIMPIAVYVLSLVFMTIRYISMSDSLSVGSSSGQLRTMMTLIRYLVFADDVVWLGIDDDNLIDTPAQMVIPRSDDMTDKDGAAYFARISGIEKFDIKFVFSDAGFSNGANVYHYAIFLPERLDMGALKGKWCTLDDVDRLLKTGQLSPMLINEIYRIYNVTMAWKTYDRDGRRLYPIKNYRPTFRFRDFRNWNVDYNDLHWLDVATNNEDKPFYRLRRFWRKNFRH